MILLLGGTTESIHIARVLLNRKLPFVLSVATDYGQKIAKEQIDALVVYGTMDEEQMGTFCKERGITTIVDATHPYASLVSQYAMKAANAVGIVYHRYERKRVDTQQALLFESYEEMAQWLNKQEGNILVTTGSKEVQKLTKEIKEIRRLFVRLLPVSSQIQKMEELGLLPRQLLAMQGPFDLEMNEAMLKSTQAKYLITKESGEVGKVEEKLIAAKNKGVQVLMLKRTVLAYPSMFSTIDELVKTLEASNKEGHLDQIAILTVTQGGFDQAKRIKQHLPSAKIYTKEFFLEPGMSLLFEKYKVLLFIMATGIVVRSIAPFIKHKSVDPAVLVMDEKGKFVISLLSGHLGSANEWAAKIAGITLGEAVITTASDVNGILAIDMLAKKLGCTFTDFETVKTLTAKKLQGEKIAIQTKWELPEQITKEYPLYEESLKDTENLKNISQNQIEGLVYIGYKKPESRAVPVVWLRPKCLVIGIGCKKQTPYALLKTFVEETFKEKGLAIDSIAAVATVDLKKEEPAILALTKELGLSLAIFSNQQIKEVEHLFEGSDFVEKSIGIRAVSEPAGYLASNKGECVVSVIKRDGMTLSVWEKKDFLL
jgi:cobalt-precorrin 5A hydrolase